MAYELGVSYSFGGVSDPFAGLNIQQEQAYPTPYAASPLLPLLLLSLASQKHSPSTKTYFSDEYDYIVVGAGSAGSVVASRLSEEPCVTVLLLEAGKPAPRLTDIPAIPRSFINTDIDWQYLTTPQKHAALGHVDRRVTWPSGKTFGGSSIFNVMLYVRGNRRNYDQWAELGAKGWSYEEVLPYFLKLEDNTDPEYLANGYHAAGGPITVSRPFYNPLKKLATIEAVLNEGYTFGDPNDDEQVGFYDYQGSIRNGQRCSTAKGYLVPAENRTNLDIVPNAMVRKVLIENKKAEGVVFDFEGLTYLVRARREVILSAGTTNTAQLLMLSGLGPLSELKKFNIPVIADLPVGLNLHEHPATTLIYEVDDSVPRFDREVREEQNILNYINLREGPLTSCEGFQLESFLSNPETGTEYIPDYTIYFGDQLNIQFLQAGFNQKILNEVIYPLANRSILNCGVQILNPRSSGTVTLQSANPYDPPLIDPNYYADFVDLENAVQGIKVCQQILDNAALKAIGAKPLDVLIPGCEEFAEDKELYSRCSIRTLVLTTNHQVGTARMGDPSDPNTVVDPQLRVKGISGLRVVDASIMPTIPWGNTNIPTIMVAEKASDIIKETIQCYK